MTILTPQEYSAALRQDFYTYMTRCFGELVGRAEFHPNWHMEVIAAKLQECMDGGLRRLISAIAFETEGTSLDRAAASIAYLTTPASTIRKEYF